MAQSWSRAAALVVGERSFPSDVVLESFMRTHDDERSQQLLGQLLRDHADPVVKDILRRKVRTCVYGVVRQIQDLEDIHSDIHVRLIKHLRRVKDAEGAAPIVNFRDYVAVVTYNAFHEYVRQRQPAWARLKNRLHYLLTHSEEFAIWESEQATPQCGLRAMRGRRAGAG